MLLRSCMSLVMYYTCIYYTIIILLLLYYIYNINNHVDVYITLEIDSTVHDLIVEECVQNTEVTIIILCKLNYEQ